MLGYQFTGQFKKDIKLAEKRRYDLDTLFDILIKIIWEEPLPEHCREHRLHGDWDGFTECHIKGAALSATYRTYGSRLPYIILNCGIFWCYGVRHY